MVALTSSFVATYIWVTEQADAINTGCKRHHAGSDSAFSSESYSEQSSTESELEEDLKHYDHNSKGGVLTISQTESEPKDVFHWMPITPGPPPSLASGASEDGDSQDGYDPDDEDSGSPDSDFCAAESKSPRPALRRRASSVTDDVFKYRNKIMRNLEFIYNVCSLYPPSDMNILTHIKVPQCAAYRAAHDHWVRLEYRDGSLQAILCYRSNDKPDVVCFSQDHVPGEHISMLYRKMEERVDKVAVQKLLEMGVPDDLIEAVRRPQSAVEV